MSVCPPLRRTFSDERGSGTFHSLGVLPRASNRKPPVFHLHHGNDSSDEHSPPSSPPASPGPQLPKGASAPILLSNGKPLKSSLKSSSSSPAVVIPLHVHLRARSESSVHKSVHFPEKDYALATVRVFNRSARPAALSSPANGNGDETETEGEETPPACFPFPSTCPTFNYEIDPAKSSLVPCKSLPANLLLESLDLSPSSFPSTSSSAKPVLAGSILVRNLAFQKHVAIRFTLDDWQTVSEVGAHYVDSPPSLPSQIVSSSHPPRPDTSPRGWDRFTFTIRLEDYAHSLSTRTLWLAARYRVDSTYPEPGSSQHGPGGEWWDNNDGGNYRVSFRPAITTPTPLRNRPRRETVSAPVSPSRTQLQPPVTSKEHALGLVVPSVSSKKEERRLSPLQTGKLNLCNYVPPKVRAVPSISLPSTGSAQAPLSSAAPVLPPSPEEDTSSPPSSTLSTPSTSPTIIPRVIIGGQPATSIFGSSEGDDDDAITYTRPGHIPDWEWSSLVKPRIEAPSRQPADPVPDSEPSEQRKQILSPPEKKLSSSSNSLYDAFVTQWCFAQGPFPSHHGYDGGVIMT